MSETKQDVVAIIPARGGSKGLPRKNIRLLAGKPLIAYAIESAKQSNLLDRIIVSTDDEQIVEVARKYGAEVPFIRPKELATDDASVESVLRHAVEWLQNNENYKVDIVVYLQCTDFFRKPEWIDICVQKLLDNNKLDSVFVACREHKNYWTKEPSKFVRLGKDRGHVSRYKKEPIYREDTGLACATRVEIIKQGKRLGDNIDIIEYDDIFIDIHSEFDLWLAEKILMEWRKES